MTRSPPRTQLPELWSGPANADSRGDREANDEWVDLALRGGEDYELLFTAPVGSWDAIDIEARKTGGTVTTIGEIIAAAPELQSIELVGRDGARRAVSLGAFDHFGEG